MPFPNEHSCRLRSPDDFEKDGWARIKQKTLSIIIGRLKGKTITTAQAYRYPTADWTEATARKHCADAGGTFEAAKKGAQEMNPNFYLDPLNNPMIPGSNEEEADEHSDRKD